jgi:hypothetical protein
VSKDDQRKQRREFKDGSTEGKPKSRRKPRSVDEMLKEGDGES